jgi:hypothetical protein
MLKLYSTLPSSAVSRDPLLFIVSITTPVVAFSVSIVTVQGSPRWHSLGVVGYV